MTPADMQAILAPSPETIAADVAKALAEDLGSGDVTASLLPDEADIAYLLCKEAAVVCGRPWFDACHRALDPVHDETGQRVGARDVADRARGVPVHRPRRDLSRAEEQSAGDARIPR